MNLTTKPLLLAILLLGIGCKLVAQHVPLAAPNQNNTKTAPVNTKVVNVNKPAEKPIPNKGTLEPEMVTIQGGSFNMGSDDTAFTNEQPMHRVTVSSFKMAKYELTVKEFAVFVAATSYQTDAEKEGKSYIFTGKWEKSDSINWRDDEEGHRRAESDYNKPVIHVSWNDAVAYCAWLSRQTGKTYRLPTEAEWEYAAGCGAKHYKYSWGNNLPGAGDRVDNVADETTHPKYGKWPGAFTGYNDGYFFASPVGSFAPNGFGLYDMSGNVRNWCADWYGAYYYAGSPTVNPQGPKSGQDQVIRGGSWSFDPTLSRIADRGLRSPVSRSGVIGFRVASSL